MEEYGMNNNNNSDGHEMKQHFQRFAKQLSDWYCNGKTPGLASQDTRFTLELQKQKLQSLGLDMQIQFRKPDTDNGSTGVLTYGDSVFENFIIGASKHITTKISNSQKEIFSSDAEGGLTIIMQNPKQGGVPSPETAMCCPNCGAPSTLGKLESGCEFCNTKFLMDELYLKVMHFFINEDIKDIFDTKQLKKYIVGFTIFFMAIGIVFMLSHSLTGELDSFESMINDAAAILGSVIPGAMFGAGAWFVVNSIRSLMLMGKNARGGKILRESDRIHISLRKIIKKPTDLGFSVMAVICPSCSASFDAAKVKVCPFCGSTYPLEENEWVVTDISI